MKKLSSYFLIITCGLFFLSCSNNQGNYSNSSSSKKEIPTSKDSHAQQENLPEEKMPQNDLSQEDMRQKASRRDCNMENCQCGDMCGCDETSKCKTSKKNNKK